MSTNVLTVAFAAALLVFGGLSAFAQEEKSAADVFAALDSNRDGKLSQAEFSRIFEMEGNTNASAQEKQQAFKAWDSDGDGAISKAEFTAKYEK
jgi:Ca2+-binding EF-hand superfamily protein